MSKKADREDKEIDRLEKDNRELKALVRQLNKRIKRLSRGYKKYLDEEPLKPEVEEVQEEVKVCWNCARGVLEKIVVLNRYWRQCTVCDKRTKTKLINE